MRRSRPKFSYWANLRRTLSDDATVNIQSGQLLRVISSFMYNWKEAPSHAAPTFYQRLLSFLLATVVRFMQQKSQSARRDSAGPSDAWPIRSISPTASRLPYRDFAIFAKFLRTFWSITPLVCVPGQKSFHKKLCSTTWNMFHTISRSHLQLVSYLRRFEGAKKPHRGSQPPNFQKGFQVGPCTLLVQNFSFTSRKLWPVAFGKIWKISVTEKQTYLTT